MMSQRQVSLPEWEGDGGGYGRRHAVTSMLGQRLRRSSFDSDRSRSPMGRYSPDSFTLQSDALQTPSKDQFQAQIHRLEQELSQARYSYDMLQQAYDIEMREHQVDIQTCVELREQLDSSRATIRTLKAKVMQLSKATPLATDEEDSSGSDRDGISSVGHHYHHAHHHHSQTVKQLEAQLATATDTIQRLESRICELDEEVTFLADGLAKTQAKNDTLIREQESFASAVDKQQQLHQDVVEALQSDIDTLKATYDAEVSRLRTEVESLQRELEDSQETLFDQLDHEYASALLSPTPAPAVGQQGAPVARNSSSSSAHGHTESGRCNRRSSSDGSKGSGSSQGQYHTSPRCDGRGGADHAPLRHVLDTVARCSGGARLETSMSQLHQHSEQPAVVGETHRPGGCQRSCGTSGTAGQAADDASSPRSCCVSSAFGAHSCTSTRGEATPKPGRAHADSKAGSPDAHATPCGALSAGTPEAEAGSDVFYQPHERTLQRQAPVVMMGWASASGEGDGPRHCNLDSDLEQGEEQTEHEVSWAEESGALFGTGEGVEDAAADVSATAQSTAIADSGTRVHVRTSSGGWCWGECDGHRAICVDEMVAVQRRECGVQSEHSCFARVSVGVQADIATEHPAQRTAEDSHDNEWQEHQQHPGQGVGAVQQQQEQLLPMVLAETTVAFGDAVSPLPVHHGVLRLPAGAMQSEPYLHNDDLVSTGEDDAGKLGLSAPAGVAATTESVPRVSLVATTYASAAGKQQGSGVGANPCCRVSPTVRELCRAVGVFAPPSSSSSSASSSRTTSSSTSSAAALSSTTLAGSARMHRGRAVHDHTSAARATLKPCTAASNGGVNSIAQGNETSSRGGDEQRGRAAEAHGDDGGGLAFSARSWALAGGCLVAAKVFGLHATTDPFKLAALTSSALTLVLAFTTQPAPPTDHHRHHQQPTPAVPE